MCHSPATTREHVPPRSFFPEQERNNLIVVPACERHNNANSIDIEYVRNILVNPLPTNEHARALFKDKVMPAYGRRKALFNRTFADLTRIVLNGQETAIYTIEIDRFNSVMKSIAYGMHHHHFSRIYYGSWVVFCRHLVFKEAFLKGRPDNAEEMRKILTSATFQQVDARNPEIFSFGLRDNGNGRLIFEFIFYGGLDVHVIGVPFWQRVPVGAGTETSGFA